MSTSDWIPLVHHNAVVKRLHDTIEDRDQQLGRSIDLCLRYRKVVIRLLAERKVLRDKPELILNRQHVRRAQP